MRARAGCIDGRLDTRNPDISFVARQSERPAGIYVWAIHAKGTIAAAIPLVLQKFSDAALSRRQHSNTVLVAT